MARTPSVTAVLISSDTSLIGNFESLFQSVTGLRLLVQDSVPTQQAIADLDDLGLVVCHLTNEGDESALAGLCQETDKRSIPTLIVSDRVDAQRARRLLCAGACDVLSRPLDLRRAAFLIDSLTLRMRARAAARRKAETNSVVAGLTRMGSAEPFLFGSPAMQEVVRRIEKVALLDTNVLLTGETGTGKSRLAALIHELSLRKGQPFLVVNCPALPETLIESELFGHRKGAFTGADNDRIGKFADARQGTLFLDEVDALPLASQAKLLRAVEARVFERVGDNASLPFQARLITATNRSLDEEVASRRFRSDLYFRLNVLEIQVPPLRQRREEIRGLSEHFLAGVAGDRPPAALAPEVVELLESYHWPGNIRELHNVLTRAAAFCSSGVIRPSDLPERMVKGGGVAPLCASVVGAELAPADLGREKATPAAGEVLASASILARARMQGELARLLEVLERHSNNRSKAARELGISRTALYKKLGKYKLLELPEPA